MHRYIMMTGLLLERAMTLAKTIALLGLVRIVLPRISWLLVQNGAIELLHTFSRMVRRTLLAMMSDRLLEMDLLFGQAKLIWLFLKYAMLMMLILFFLWGTGDHGDTAPFDGRANPTTGIGRVLAHTLGGPP